MIRLEDGTVAPRAPLSFVASTSALGLLHLRHGHCRFPVGSSTGADQLFCGAATTKSWCACHAQVVFARALSDPVVEDAGGLPHGPLSNPRHETTP